MDVKYKKFNNRIILYKRLLTRSPRVVTKVTNTQ